MSRFISEDPIEFAGGVNLYAYVENDPLSFRDPFGLDKDEGRDNCAGGATTFENPVTREALRAALAQQATRRLEQSGMVYQNRWTRNFGYRLIDDFWASQTGTQMDKIGWIEVLLYKPVVTFHTHPIGPKYPAYVGPSETDIKTFVRLYPRAGPYHVVVNESRVYTISPSGTACQIGWTPSAIAR